MAFGLILPWNWLYITTSAGFRNQKLPTDSADEAEILASGLALNSETSQATGKTKKIRKRKTIRLVSPNFFYATVGSYIPAGDFEDSFFVNRS